MSEMKQYQKEIEAIMQDTTLTYWQRTDALAKYAENLLDYPEGTPEEFFDDPQTDRAKRFLNTFTFERKSTAT